MPRTKKVLNNSTPLRRSITTIACSLILRHALLFADNIAIRGANRAEYRPSIDSKLDTANYKEHVTEKMKLSLYGLRADFKSLKSRITLLTGTPRNIFFEVPKYRIKNDTTDRVRDLRQPRA